MADATPAVQAWGMLKKLDMVLIRVRDWTGAVAWYSDTLGLQVAHREDDDQFCLLALPEGETKLALLGDATAQPDESRCRPNILVDDLDATLNELRGKGVTIKGMPSGNDEGYRLAGIEDPEGNVVQLYEWI